MGIFNWSYPPGCNLVPGDEPDPPCEVCGQSPDDCICPECRVCHAHGNPDCYDDLWIGGGHGMKRSLEQQIGKLELEIAIDRENLRKQEDYLAEMKTWIACRDHAANFGIVCPSWGSLACYEDIEGKVKPCYMGCPA